LELAEKSLNTGLERSFQILCASGNHSLCWVFFIQLWQSQDIFPAGFDAASLFVFLVQKQEDQRKKQQVDGNGDEKLVKIEALQDFHSL
jgi:hypothetical protein